MPSSSSSKLYVQQAKYSTTNTKSLKFLLIVETLVNICEQSCFCQLTLSEKEECLSIKN